MGGLGRGPPRARRDLPVQALVADTMLHRRAIPSEVRIGVRMPPTHISLDAHAWVESNGLVVVGTIDRLVDYRVLRAVAPR